MSAAAFEVIGLVEVLMRNAIDRALADAAHEDERKIPWFLCDEPLDGHAAEAVEATRRRLREESPQPLALPHARDTRDRIVEGLTFGFWSGMLATRYEELWRQALRHAFPGSNGTRKQVAVTVEAVRKFRNRLAHHGSLLTVDVPFEMRRVRQLAALLGPEIERWVGIHDRTDEVYRQRPEAPRDTVVVAAKDAWPLYEQHFIYVCQSRRRFQPVERIAFYCDREIKPEIPEIVARRDEVPWTDREAQRLLASQDREDRKIGRAIQAARQAGWTDGVYQVFLLTRPGSPDHRQLQSPLPHQTSGRGSAFTQRQRYVALHALETAGTTADLVPME